MSRHMHTLSCMPKASRVLFKLAVACDSLRCGACGNNRAGDCVLQSGRRLWLPSVWLASTCGNFMYLVSLLQMAKYCTWFTQSESILSCLIIKLETG